MFVIVYGFRHRAHKPVQALLTSSSQINTAASFNGGKEKKLSERERVCGMFPWEDQWIAVCNGEKWHLVRETTGTRPVLYLGRAPAFALMPILSQTSLGLAVTRLWIFKLYLLGLRAHLPCSPCWGWHRAARPAWGWAEGNFLPWPEKMLAPCGAHSSLDSLPAFHWQMKSKWQKWKR